MKTGLEYQTIIDETTTPGVVYICKAELGRKINEPYWQIKAIDATGSRKFPVGPDGVVSEKLEFIASSRATYTYAYNV